MARRALPYGLKRYGGDTFHKIHKCGSGCLTASGVPDLFNKGHNGRLALFAHIMGVKDLDIEDNELMQRGHRLQPVAVEMYAEETGEKARNIHARVKHPDMDFYASPDVLTTRPGDVEERPGEVKVVTVDTWQTLWEPNDRPPEKVLIQHQAQLALTGASSGPIIALIIGEFTFKIRHWEIAANPRFQKKLLLKVNKALKDIQEHRLPPPDLDHLNEQKAAIALALADIQDVIDLPEQAQSWIDMYQRIGKIESRLRKKRTEAKARLIDAMNGHAGGVIGDTLVKLKLTDVDEKTHAAYTTRKLSFKSMERAQEKTNL